MQTKFILAFAMLVCLAPRISGSIIEKMGQDQNNPNAVKNLNFGSVGVGYGSGFLISSGFTYRYDHVGMSISMNALWARAKDLPNDYTGWFPNDNLYTISLRGVFGGSPDENAWLGIEVGPSYVNFRKEVETLNPNYGGGWVLDKYYRDNVVFKTIGLSGRLKVDFMFSDNLGLELALGFNLNRYKSTFGIEGCFLFGKLK